MKSRFAWIHLLACMVAISGSARAQDSVDAKSDSPNGSSGETFFGSVSVNVVGVEVYVTDKKGNPITGLSKSDFQIFEDKQFIKPARL